MTTTTRLTKVKYMPLSSYNTSTDTSDVICAVEVTNLLNNGCLPNWSSKIALTSGTTYTVGSGALAGYSIGWVWHSKSSAGGNDFTCSINGVTFLGGWSYQDGNDAKVIFFPVSSGNYFTCNNGTDRYFIPPTWSI